MLIHVSARLAHGHAQLATMVSVVAGLLCTLVALVCNGSFAVFAKLPRIAAIGVAPVTFMMFMAVGVVATSFLSILLYPLLPLSPPHVVWTWYGVMSGALFVCSVTCSFLGIKYVGLAVAQGTTGGSRLNAATYAAGWWASLPALERAVLRLTRPCVCVYVCVCWYRDLGCCCPDRVVRVGRGGVRQPR